MLHTKLQEILPLVEKPARYVDNEWNSIRKNWDDCSIRMVFAFPDIYEIGMSHLGLQILYGLVNSKEDMLMERVFAPWGDMEQKMREEGIPLYSLESRCPVRDFDVLGFTLQYELSYTNILNMLYLAGIPLRSGNRGQGYPLVIAGGPAAFNPEPLAPFFDAFVIGDAEEALPEVLELLKEHKQKYSKVVREEFLRQIIGIQGVYVPSYYNFEYRADGTVLKMEATPPAPEIIKKRVVRDFEQVYYPEKPIVPNMETVHDRIMLEVARGCTRGCRFCQAGIIYRPVREKGQEVLVKQAEELAASTGHSEISLVSLNTADYSAVVPLAGELSEKMGQRGISISLPSLRVDKFSVDLANELQRVRKSTLTFAPEAGTQRLRDVINKGVTEEHLMEAVSSAFSAGWDQIKLYFMIGLPTETSADLDGIAELAFRVLERGRQIKGKKGKGRVKVTVSVSNFVPKAHTPFQWAAQDTVEVIEKKQAYLREKLRHGSLRFNYHDARQSFLEGVFSKGNRELAAVLETAWAKGCRFDSWSEQFRPEKWEEAFEECGYDAVSRVNSPLDLQKTLPWEHIHTGVSRGYLLREYEKGIRGEPTSDCRTLKCSGCGVCGNLEAGMELRG